MSKRKLTYKDFKNYFSNNLQKKDKHAFEKNMMRDTFEEEAFEGLSELSAEELESDIAELELNIHNRTKKTKRIIPIWFRYAASVLVLVGIGLTVLFMNSRYWQNSMLKEQVAEEMEIVDSMIIESKQTIQEAKQFADSVSEKPKEFIAEGKDIKPKKDLQPKRQIEVLKEKNELVDLDISEDDLAIVADEEMVVVEFEEEEEEVVVEENVLAAQPNMELEELGASEGEVYAKQEEAEEIDKSAKKKANIQIRGVASQSKEKGPLYVIDGKPVDLENAKTIKGKILSSEDNMAIPGVSVVLKDMNIFGTVTDTSGEFSITIPNDEELKTLIASFVGMQTQEISLENDSNLLVYMDSEMLAMDEVVVTSYGVDREEETPVRVSAKAPEDISYAKYKKKVVDNINYLLLAGFPGKYRIKVSFTVGANGELFNFNFKNAPNDVFTNEIIRVIKNLGNWIPAQEDGKNVESRVKLVLKIEIN